MSFDSFLRINATKRYLSVKFWSETFARKLLPSKFWHELF